MRGTTMRLQTCLAVRLLLLMAQMADIRQNLLRDGDRHQSSSGDSKPGQAPKGATARSGANAAAEY